jgi:hypothetical protein
LDIKTTTHRSRVGRGRPMAIALAVVFAVALPVPAFAQDASEAPASTAPSAEATESGVAFPVMLGGQLLTAENYSGPEWLALFAEGDSADPAFVEGTEALLAAAGASIDDLTIKSALYQPEPTPSSSAEVPSVSPASSPEVPSASPALEPTSEPAVVLAMRIAGTDANDWIEGAVDLMVGDIIDPGLVLRPLDTKWTLRVTDATMPGVYPRTVYLNDDTAWFIQGDNDYVWDALSQLPDADHVAPSAADSLYTDVPIALGERRRIGLYESTEPLFLPTLGERLGSEIDNWLVDLYVEAGISPAEMLGVIAWWGFEGTQDSIQIEGYRLPEGGAEMTQRLLEDVFLVRPPEQSADPEVLPTDGISALLAGATFTEQEIAGRPVSTLDFGGAKQHIFASDDTIWVVSDPSNEPELAEQAIAQLP